MDVPFAAFFLGAIVWAVFIAMAPRSEALRNGALLCGSVLFSLAIVEVCFYYVTKSQIIITRTVPEAWRVNAMGLGSLPVPNTATEFKEFLDGRPDRRRNV